MSYRNVAIILALVATGLGSPARADVVTQWNQIAIQSTKTAALSSNQAPRALAIVHIAIYDALTAIEKKYEPYHAELEASGELSPEIAALGAAHYALVVLFPTQRIALNQALNAALSKLPKGDVRTKSLALGVAAASDILDLRTEATDGSLFTPPAEGTPQYARYTKTVTGVPPAPVVTTFTYTGSTDVGQWRPTPTTAGSPKPGLDPQWATITPFVLTAPDAFRAPPPPALDSAAYTTDSEEVRLLGAKTGSTRTSEQSQIASFWAQNTHLPYNAIARQVSNARGLSIYDNARLFALLNIAIADARAAVWDSKYFYNAWRPVTSITRGAADPDNDNIVGTTEDPTWLPYLDTPNHPEYPSGHSATGAAAAAALASFLGDDTGFTVASETLADVTRSFASFTQSAKENGRSRIYGGLHFTYSNNAGQTLGKSVGDYAAGHLFAALPPPPPPPPDAGIEEEDAGLVADAGGVEPVVDAGGNAEPDAGPTAKPDAGAPAGDDAGSYLVDAGIDLTDKDDDGCSVSRVGSTNSTTPALLVLGAIAFWARRRRLQVTRSKR